MPNDETTTRSVVRENNGSGCRRELDAPATRFTSTQPMTDTDEGDIQENIDRKKALSGADRAIDYCEDKGWSRLALEFADRRHELAGLYNCEEDYACGSCEYTGPMTVPAQTCDMPMTTKCPACGTAADHSVADDA